MYWRIVSLLIPNSSATCAWVFLSAFAVADCSVAVRGGKGRPRKVCFAPSVAVILERYLKDYRPVRAQAGESALFVNLEGARMARNTLNHRVAQYGKKLGIPNVTPHALRRAFATHLLENGASTTSTEMKPTCTLVPTTTHQHLR